MLRLIAGLEHPNSGNIRLLNKESQSQVVLRCRRMSAKSAWSSRIMRFFLTSPSWKMYATD
ncbi:hypothetical protein [Nitritalea halalkaliphila]|uniref:hypothetical protein n=1 Tax=Nitritalea halalkaliphila TaxID=590849 RepID=UPI00373FC6E6